MTVLLNAAVVFHCHTSPHTVVLLGSNICQRDGNLVLSQDQSTVLWQNGKNTSRSSLLAPYRLTLLLNGNLVGEPFSRFTFLLQKASGVNWGPVSV